MARQMNMYDAIAYQLAMGAAPPRVGYAPEAVGYEVAGDFDFSPEFVGAEYDFTPEFVGADPRQVLQAWGQMKNVMAAAGRRPMNEPPGIAIARQQIAAQNAPRVVVPMNRYDRVYNAALDESGNDLPATSLFNVEGAFADGAAVGWDSSCPRDCVLDSLLIQLETIGTLRNVSLTIGGNPIGGVSKFGVGRFSPDSTERRLQPVQINAGMPVKFSGTAAVTGGGTKYISVDLLACDLSAGPTFASRRQRR